MEQSSVVDATLGIYRRLREAGHPDRHGPPQSYLFRTEGDLVALLPLAPNLRFVKAAYLERPDVAYADKTDVDSAFARLVETALRGGAYAAIATHDERLIERLIAFAEREGIGRDRRAPDALRRARGPAASWCAEVQGARRDARPEGSAITDATPRGASGEPRLHPAERRSPLTVLRPEPGEELAAAVHPDLGEDRLGDPRCTAR